MKKILVLFLLFFSCQVFAVELPPNNSWSWKHHKLQREKNRLQAHLIKNVNDLGSSKTIEAVVETKPTASKVGGSMMKRVMATGGGQMIGVMAVVELIEAIGWVMEDGTYVKKIITEGVPNCGANFYYKNNEAFNKLGNSTLVCDTSQAKSAAQKYFNSVAPSSNPALAHKVNTCSFNSNNSAIDCSFGFYGDMNDLRSFPFSKVTHNEKPADEKTVPLTPVLLGAAMLGKGYEDPDPDFNNDTVNTDNWTGVPEAYTPDPSGVGNELADALEDKADRAPKTPDGKAAPIGDPKYQNPLDDDDDANDRQWDGEEGTEGSTSGTEKTDPETGEKITEGTFSLPKFCDWAMTVCEWYEGWKKTDVKVNQHIDDTKQHQTEEKGFWQSVKDWFDWTKEEPELEDEPLEIQETEIIDYQHVNYVQFGSSCPFSPQVNSLPMGMLGSLDFETDLSFICDFGVEARPYILGLGHLGALIFLLIGIRNGNG